MIRDMSKDQTDPPEARRPSRRKRQEPMTARLLDLERYVPAFITFIANKLSNSATAYYQRNFGVNVTEWRIMSLLAIEPGIPASRICHVIGFDKGPVSRTLSVLQKRGLVAIRTAPDDGRTHSISLTVKGRATHDKVIVAALERERRLLSVLKKDEREVLIDLCAASTAISMPSRASARSTREAERRDAGLSPHRVSAADASLRAHCRIEP